MGHMMVLTDRQVAARSPFVVWASVVCKHWTVSRLWGMDALTVPLWAIDEAAAPMTQADCSVLLRPHAAVTRPAE
jgi:type IV secretory pathway protease TraF